MYKSQVRPILEYGVTIWYPQLKKDVHSVEKVQRRLTKLIPHLKERTYPERLMALKLPSLTYRRYRGDMINTWKFLTSGYDVDESKLFTQAVTGTTRGHSKKLFKPGHRTKARGLFFSQRIITMWNNLPEDVITATTINSFKNALDREWADQEFLYNYEAVYK